MTLNKHITRNFDANRTNIIRPEGEEFRFEIFKFDKTQDVMFTAVNPTFTHNGHNVWHDGMTGLKVGKGSAEKKKEEVKKSLEDLLIDIGKSAMKKAKNTIDKKKGIRTTTLTTNIASQIEKENNIKAVKDKAVINKYLTMNFSFDAKKSSQHYRIEILYSNSYKFDGDDVTIHRDCAGEVYVNGNLEKDTLPWASNDVIYNRHHIYTGFKKGKNTITVSLSPNLVFYGLIIRKYDLWETHYPLRNDDDLVPISAEVSHTDEFKVNTMTCSFMYSHILDEVLDATDENANRSGLVFDYRDEINWYVKNNAGIEEQVFGGYISTANVDDKLTTLTMECSDRLIDLDRRYCISEIATGDVEDDDKEKHNFAIDSFRNFNNYSDVIEFLSNMTELPLQNNLTLGKPLVPRKTKILRTYKVGKTSKLTAENMTYDVSKKCITLRNGINRNKEQVVTIFSSDKGVEINSKPIMFLNYGLGEAENDEEVTETTLVVKQKGVAKSVTDLADKQKGSGDQLVKAMWSWIANNVTHEYKKNFYQTPAKTLSRKKGNCCCKAELLLDMCNYKGITDLQYVHTKLSPEKGHVFCKINGRIVDPSTKSGWGNYSKYGGKINSSTKYSRYPTKPF